jgi:hypothetical protein
MVRTGVPQAAVDEHCYALSGEEDIGATSHALERQGGVDPVAKSKLMQVTAQR